MPFNPKDAAVLALLLPAALLSRRRRVPTLALFVSLTCALGVLGGCGTGRVIPTATSGGITTSTSDGTYTLTVSATSAGLTHSVHLTLIVQ